MTLHHRPVTKIEFPLLCGSIEGANLLLPVVSTLCDAGIARGAFHGSLCYSLHGVYPVREGLGEAWMISDAELLRSHPISAVKSAREVIKQAFEKFNFHRIQMSVLCDFHMRWCEAIGFTLEGIMQQYTIDKQDHALFAITK